MSIQVFKMLEQNHIASFLNFKTKFLWIKVKEFKKNLNKMIYFYSWAEHYQLTAQVNLCW